ncbi:GPI inositol-deacylase-like [Dysidea avara]|uniref:GPI inositol-deacylase-like n=1 Tax=Dysidea avara TaxID=196820 RepID=UPI00331DA8B4
MLKFWFVLITVTMVIVMVTVKNVWETVRQDHTCEMTWMFDMANYTEIRLPSKIQKLYPTYGLYFYGEGIYAAVYRVHPLEGIPVLFIPGNRGSYKQGRSAGSIAMRMAGVEFPKHRHFNHFLVDLNEEFSGIFGGTLLRQAEYVRHCISHILTLYSHLSNPPTTVTVLAHSMGGMVARALFTLDTFDTSLVNLIITMASPHARPVAYSDMSLYMFYQQVDEAWNSARVDNVTLVSIAAGEKDLQVPRHLTQPKVNSDHGTLINYLTHSVPRHWKSSDHQAIVWCRRLQLSLSRAFFNMQHTNKLDLDPNKYHTVLDQWLSNPPVQHQTLDQFPRVDTTNISWEWSIQSGHDMFISCKRNDTNRVKITFLAYQISAWLRKWQMVTVASNMNQDPWLLLCQIKSDNVTLSNCQDASKHTLQLPPVYGTIRVMQLSLWNHKNYIILAASPRYTSKQNSNPQSSRIKDYSYVNFHNGSSHTVTLPNLFSGYTVVKLVARCPLSTVNLEAIDSPWSQVYKVTVILQEDRSNSSYPFVLSVGPFVDSVSLGYHSSYGSLPLAIKFDMTLETHYKEAHFLIWSGQTSKVEIHIQPDAVGVVSKVVCDCLPDLIWWCLMASVMRISLCYHVQRNPTLVISLVFLTLNFPLVLSSLTTGPVLTNIVPVTTDSLILMVFLLLLVAGVHCFVELCCWVVLLLAQQLFFRNKQRLCFILTSLAPTIGLATCSSVSINMLFFTSLIKASPKNSRHLVPLFWISAITTPTLLAWIHATINRMILSPDPHYAFSLLVHIILFQLQ